jgi:hypothetical protein
MVELVYHMGTTRDDLDREKFLAHSAAIGLPHTSAVPSSYPRVSHHARCIFHPAPNMEHAIVISIARRVNESRPVKAGLAACRREHIFLRKATLKRGFRPEFSLVPHFHRKKPRI